MEIHMAISSSHVTLYMLEVIEGGHVWFAAQAGEENLDKHVYPGDCCWGTQTWFTGHAHSVAGSRSSQWSPIQ